ncbi:MAG: peptidylprolyl isomerase [Candidatus Limnocylindria bacterium]
MRGRALLIGLAFAGGLAACGADPTPEPSRDCPTGPPTDVGAQAELADAAQAVVTVSGAVEGTFTLELYGEAAPIATANFVALARCGFYDQIAFHRVLDGFVVQAGDPQTRDNRGDFEGLGTGGPGYEFEIEAPADDLGYDPYALSMANDTRTNGSQFFINLADLNDALTRTYTIFGRVVEGTEVVDQIGAVPVGDPQIGVPVDPVIIESVVIEAAAEES